MTSIRTSCAALVAASILVLAVGCGEQSPKAPPIVLPQDETALLSIVTGAQAEAAKVENDMQLGGVKAKRDSTLCATITSLVVQNWVGKVEDVSSNSDGKGVFKVSVARDVLVKTWNNAFSDMGSGTLFEPGTPLFAAASAMKRGDYVTFSGNFFKGREGDCLNEASMTLRGKVREPEFIFKFESIALYSPQREASAPAAAAAPVAPAPLPAPALGPTETVAALSPQVDEAPAVNPPETADMPATQLTPAEPPAAQPVAVPVAVAVKPSFDCAKASTLIEELVCKDPELSAQDAELAVAYRAARTTTADEAGLKAAQLAWLKNARNKCTSAQCLSAAYSDRLAALSK